MAETAPTISVDDVLGLGAGFEAQNSGNEETGDFDVVVGATSNYACSREHNTGDAKPFSYRYCSASPDIDGDLDALMTAFGDVINSLAVNDLSIQFEAGIAATISGNAHQHDANPHTALRSADVSGIIPASSGVGVPTLITVAGTVSPVSATLTFEPNHVDKIGADGGHFHGQNIGPCRVSLSVQYEGLVTSATAGDWLNIKIVTSKDNQDTPTSSLTAEQFVDWTV